MRQFIGSGRGYESVRNHRWIQGTRNLAHYLFLRLCFLAWLEPAGARELGVFVKDGDQYEFVPLSIGRSDGRISEVLNGAASGTQYVAGNSFLIKADIEKSTAEHDH